MLDLINNPNAVSIGQRTQYKSLTNQHQQQLLNQNTILK